MESSKPSLRMFSIKTPICNSPRPATSNASPLGVSVTLIATLVSASLSNRSLIIRDWTFFPSLPAIGLSLIPNVTEIVGGSMGCAGIAFVISTSHKVSETVALDIPAIVTMSPASAEAMACCANPLNAKIFETLKFSTLSPFRAIALIISPDFIVPDSTLPVKIRPIN